MKVDLVLSGGTICDGTGTPARAGDVVISDGRVLGTGRYDGPTRRRIDVGGLIVAPGFVDVHTHYDAQVWWDPLLTPSCWHGVTTAVIGNCGFSLAPCPPQRRERLLRMLEHVEGMAYESLAAGVTWEWETVPEMAAALDRRSLGANVAFLLGHSAIRAAVLGDESYERPAGEAEIARMAELVREGMAAGAVGFATSRSPGHVGEGGRPVPSRAATPEELRALVRSMAESGRGTLEITPETFPISPAEIGLLEELARESGRPVTWSAVLDLPDRSDAWPPVFARLRLAAARGAHLFPQVSCRPMRFEFDLERGCASLDALASWRRFRACEGQASRLALLGDESFRRALRSETLARPGSLSARRWETVELLEAERPENRALVGRSLGEIARERGGDPFDALLDISREEGLRARFSMLLLNFDEDRVAELLRQPESLIALSDAGAHVAVLCDAGYPTWLLGHWVRERKLFSWEEGVRRLTAMPADVFGLSDRGRLLPGAAADVVCFDPERVAMGPIERWRDLPGGAERCVARADGIEWVFVAGSELLHAGQASDARPGRLLRGA